ncbi:MAG: CHAT domain-containing protein [Ardenticatenaceae bacterium]
MTHQAIPERLLAQYEQPDFELLLEELRPHLTVDLIAHLKKRVDEEKLKDAHLALRIATLAQALVPQISEPEAEALAYWAKGTALMHLSRYREALGCYQSAVAIYVAQEQKVALVGIQAPMVEALRALGDHHAALALAEKTREICLRLGSPAQRTLGYLEMNVGIVYNELGNPEAALAAYQRASDIFVQLGDAIQVARLDTNRSIILREMSRFSAAQELLLSARQSLATKPQEVARVDFNLGMLAYRRGRYQEALTHFEAARRGLAGIDTLIALVDLRRCLIYRQLNLLQETIDMAAAAEPIFAQNGRLVEQVRALHQQGMGYQLAGHYPLAERYLMKARQLLPQQEERAIVFELDYDLACLAYKSGRINDARQRVQPLSQTIAADTSPRLAAQVRLLLAQCSLQEEPERALAYAQAALELSSAYSLHEITIAAHHLMAQILERTSQRSGAWSEYQKAMQLIESLRVQFLVDEFRIGFMEDKQPIYADAVRLCQQTGTPAQLLYTLNLAHTAPLLFRDSSTKQSSHELQSELVALREKWHLYQNKLEEASTQKDAGTINALRPPLNKIETELAELTRRWQVRHTSNFYSYQKPTAQVRRGFDRQLFGSDAADQFLATIQQSLGPNEVLLHYYVVNDTFQALLVTTDAIHLRPNLAASKALARILRGWSRHITHTELISQSPLTSVALSQRYLTRLYQKLFAPLASDLAPDSQLFVVMPPGWQELPLAAFFDGQHYLAQRYQISYLSAPEVLTDTRTPLESTARALIIGHSNDGQYPGILHATQTIAQNFPADWQSTLLMDADATFEKFKIASRESNLIHLATHATFRADNPLFSWARLAEHRLTVAQLYQMKLPQNPLVVFSACETGRGKARGGGLLGMGRALLAAGASGLVVTLWRVEDQATAQLMVDFYSDLSSKQKITNEASAALRHAQQQAIAQQLHPFFWAGFIFIQG